MTDRCARGRAPRLLLWATIALALLGAGHLLSDAARAHERRVVGGYAIEVGFRDEPAIARYPNALEMTVTRADSGEPVTGLEGTLRMELLSVDGSQRRELVLLPAVDGPGRYTSELFILSRPGEYVFRLVGQVRGQPVEALFPTEAVQDPSALQFPPGASASGASDGEGLALPLSAAALALGLAGAVCGLYALLRTRGRAA
ncbi:hypothetical protein HRbin25_00872 [bacterium HR25]|nr:hypothetical protein HRbin25_00872 [bacterium HR25]